MLVLPQCVYDARERFWRAFQSGKSLGERDFQRLLDQDPDDLIGLLGLGRLRLKEGDPGAANEHFWAAIHAHPTIGSAYLQLGELLANDRASKALSTALLKLGLSKEIDDGDLPKKEQYRSLFEAMNVPPAGEPDAVATRMRPLRLLHEIQEGGDLDALTVDAVIDAGRPMVTLLIGLLRDWAQDLLVDKSDSAAENAIALLGEAGSPSEISLLFEFVDIDNETVAGASSWALGRILERHPEEAIQVLRAMELDSAERLTLAAQILFHPLVDSEGIFLQYLGERLESMKQDERDAFYPPYLLTCAAARGREAVVTGRQSLMRNRALLSQGTRRQCQELLAEFEKSEFAPQPPEPPYTVYEICSGQADWTIEDPDDEEEDLYPPEPVRRTAAPGRNDPCWCGSGKKYKKCHLDSDSAGEGEGSSNPGDGKNEFEHLRSRIGNFLGEVVSARDLDLMNKEFLFDLSRNQDHGEMILSDWMAHDWIVPKLRGTIMHEFLVRQGGSLTKRERDLVEAWSTSYVGFYEVQELNTGIGVELKDLILGGTAFIHDINLSRSLAKWDCLLARVVPGERGLEVTGSGLNVPRANVEPFREWLAEDRAEMGLEWKPYLKRNWPRIRVKFLEINESHRQSFRLANTDGEELLFCKSLYRIVDEGAVLNALRGSTELDPESDRETERKHFVWLSDNQTLLADIRITGDELVLECNSRKRMQRGKKLLLKAAGKQLRHVRDEFTTQQEIKRSAMENPRPTHSVESEIPKEVQDKVVGRALEEHYAAWPDMKLPALDGKTPRQAARTFEGRKQLVELLKFIENGEDRKRRSGQMSYDVSRLRAELGLKS